MNNVIHRIPIVSIIIPTLNEAKIIDKCLTAIKRLDTPKGRYEIILVDNGSTDKTVEIAQNFDVKIFLKPKVTISALRNLGAKNARGVILAFLDADCIVSENWLNTALPYFDSLIIGAVGSRYRIPEDSTWVAKVWDLNSYKYMIKGEIEWLSGGNIFVSRKLFNLVNGFDERILTNEDYDFCIRLREKGYKILSDPGISVVHLGSPQTLSGFFKKQLWHGKDVFRVFLRGLPRLRNFKAVSYGLFYAFSFIAIPISLIFYLVRGYYLPLMLFPSLVFFVPLSLALKTVARTKKAKYLLKLTVIYLIYGIARSVSILDFRNWLPLLKRKPSNPDYS